MPAAELERAYRHCQAVAAGHYENFPVASRLLPARLRRPVAVIYAFARAADDLADEGDLAATARLEALERYGQRLDAAAAGDPPADDPVFVALADVLERFSLPVSLLHDLLSAFRQDVTRRRYQNYEQVLDYCRRSADPVGRLLLHLDGSATPDRLQLSDRICTALQLTNFLQDLAQDYDENDRIYLPLEEMAAAGVSERHLRDRVNDAAMRKLFADQVRRTRSLMLSGAPLGERLSGRFGWEIRLIVEGGLAVLDRLAAAGDAFSRPRLRRRDLAWMLLRSLRPPRPFRRAARRARAAGQ